MSAFTDRTERACIDEAMRVFGRTDASTELTTHLSSTLAVVIAVTTGGDPMASDKLARLLAEELPGLVESRAAAVRQLQTEGFGGVQ